MHGSVRRIVFGHPDAQLRAEVGQQLCHLGWEAHTAATGPETRKLTNRWKPHLVILASTFTQESGWLTCAKLRHERPEQYIILLDSELTPADHRFARFVGATRVISDRRLPELIDAISDVAGVTAGERTLARIGASGTRCHNGQGTPAGEVPPSGLSA
jgi:CheY-like chemotaxis protein